MIVSSGEYFLFQMKEEVYGIDISYIREICQYKNPTVIPCLPSYILGVMDLRGEPISLIDLALKMNIGPTEIGNNTCILVLETPGKTKKDGILVDTVLSVEKIDQDMIGEIPNFKNKDLYVGIGKLPDRMVLLLDPDRLF